VRGGGVRLFLSVCLPLTAVTLAIWAAMYGVARRWARRRGRDLGLPGYGDGDGDGYADERGVVGGGGELSPQRVPDGMNLNEKEGGGVMVMGV
jgi:hypothetical protein